MKPPTSRAVNKSPLTFSSFACSSVVALVALPPLITPISSEFVKAAVVQYV